MMTLPVRLFFVIGMFCCLQSLALVAIRREADMRQKYLSVAHESDISLSRRSAYLGRLLPLLIPAGKEEDVVKYLTDIHETVKRRYDRHVADVTVSIFCRCAFAEREPVIIYGADRPGLWLRKAVGELGDLSSLQLPETKLPLPVEKWLEEHPPVEPVALAGPPSGGGGGRPPRLRPVVDILQRVASVAQGINVASQAAADTARLTSYRSAEPPVAFAVVDDCVYQRLSPRSVLVVSSKDDEEERKRKLYPMPPPILPPPPPPPFALSVLVPVADDEDDDDEENKGKHTVNWPGPDEDRDEYAEQAGRVRAIGLTESPRQSTRTNANARHTEAPPPAQIHWYLWSRPDNTAYPWRNAPAVGESARP